MNPPLHSPPPFRRATRRLLSIAGIVIVAPILIVLAWSAWERLRNPLAAINPESLEADVVRDSAYIAGGRNFRDIVLYSNELDTIRFTLSLPPDPDAPLPVVLVVGGLEIGRESLSYVRDQGENAIVAYEYPYGPKYWYEGAPMGRIPAIRSAALSVPGQLAALLRYISERPWADPRRRACFSYSFGSIFAPSFLRVAEAHGDTVPYTVLVYGGADIELLLDHNLRIASGVLRRLFAWLAATAIHVVEPEEHLPYLHSSFLVVNGLRDQLIPLASSRRFQEAVPPPKFVRMLDTRHMHPKATDLIDSLVTISRQWLRGHGAWQ